MQSLGTASNVDIRDIAAKGKVNFNIFRVANISGHNGKLLVFQISDRREIFNKQRKFNLGFGREYLDIEQ